MIHIIINPIAGNGRAVRALPRIEKILRDREIPYELLRTAKSNDAEKLAKRAVSENSDGVIVVGGDGTLQEAAQGIYPNKIPIGMIPLGSGNDFITSAINYDRKIKKPGDIVDFHLNKILDGMDKPRPVDIVLANDRIFVNIGSLGVDAQVAFLAEKLKRFGKLSYLFALIRMAFVFSTFGVKLEIDGRESEEEITLIALANGKRYGGGFIIAPDAKVDDGLITICLVSKISRPKFMVVFPLVLFGKHGRLREVSFVECKKLTVRNDYGNSWNLDGNMAPLGKEVSFELIRDGILLMGTDL